MSFDINPKYMAQKMASLCWSCIGQGRTPQEQEMLRREVESTDRAIDRLVYELPRKGVLYGLSEEEIRIVEGKE